MLPSLHGSILASKVWSLRGSQAGSVSAPVISQATALPVGNASPVGNALPVTTPFKLISARGGSRVTCERGLTGLSLPVDGSSVFEVHDSHGADG